DEVAARWVDAAAKAKRIPSDSPLGGEEWLSGPWALLKGLNVLISTLEKIENGKPVVANDSVRTASNGQVVVDVFPTSLFDRLLLSGFSAEVWMQPGVTREKLAE